MIEKIWIWKILQFKKARSVKKMIMENMKKILCVLLVGLLLIAIPVQGVWDDDQENEMGFSRANGRHPDIVINDLMIIQGDDFAVSEANGVYANGRWMLIVNFTLGIGMENVNVTINATLGGYHFENSSNPEVLTGGQQFQGCQIDFANEGVYDINVTVGAWNGTAEITSNHVFNAEFRTIIQYDVDIAIDANEKDGYYPKDIILINNIVNNTGNYEVDNTNVSVTIEDHTTHDPEQVQPPFLDLDSFSPDDIPLQLFFSWQPSHEGTFDIEVIVRDINTGTTNTSSMQIQIQNITEFHLVDFMEMPFISVNDNFIVGVQLNNTGNAKGKADVRLDVYPDGEPANIIYTSTVESGLVEPTQGGTSSREPINPFAFFENVSCDEEGTFVLKATLIGSGDYIDTTIDVDPQPNIAPGLENISVMPGIIVSQNTNVIFQVDYRDLNNDPGTVTLYIDDQPHQMVNSSDDWGNIVQFTYTWIAEHGDHTYYFVAEDEHGDNFTLDNATQKYPLFVLPPTDGYVRGRALNDLGEPVADVELVIYNLVDGNIGTYYYATTDSQGNYSVMLPFLSGENDIYVLKVDFDWLKNNGFKNSAPSMKNFILNVNKTVEWINFTLERKPVVTLPKLMGYVMDTNGSLIEGAKITVIIYADEERTESIEEMDGGIIKNITVNVTTRTWYNITGTTDSAGLFNITDIPLAEGDIKILQSTGLKEYWEHIDNIPTPSEENRWFLNIEKDGYTFLSANVTSQTKYLEIFNQNWVQVWLDNYFVSWANFTLMESEGGEINETIWYYLSGNVTPEDAVVKVDGNTVEHNGSHFSIHLLKGTYTLTVTAQSYDTYSNEIDLTENKDLQIELTLTMVDVVIGPFVDSDGNNLQGVKVYFGDKMRITDTSGKATFQLPEGQGPKAGDTITYEYDGKEYEADWPLVEEDMKIKTGSKTESSGSSNMLLYIAIVIIIIVIVVLVILAMKSKKITEEEFEELECPDCGASVTSLMTECPECGLAFDDGRCPTCGAEVTEDMTECAECGTEFEFEEEEEDEEGEGEDEEEEEELEEEEEYDEDAPPLDEDDLPPPEEE